MTEILIAILNMSIAASIVAAVVILVRFPLKKAPKIFSYALWAAVFLRLICPFNFESPASLMPTNAEIIPPTIVTAPVPQINSGIPAVDVPVNLFIKGALPQTNPVASVNPVQAALSIGAYIWLCGLVVLVLYAIVGYIRVKRQVYDATLIRDNIFETDKIPTAFVLGFIRPKIYLPTAVKGEQLDFILKHEQVHIRRRDYLIKPFAFLIVAVHWFNPIVWISYYLMSKDIEMSCDEAVLRKSNEDIRQTYSVSLVNLYTRKPGLLSPLAFGEGSYKNMKARIKNVVNFKKTPRWAIVICSFMLVLFMSGFTTNPPQKLTVDKLSNQFNTTAKADSNSLFEMPNVDTDSYYAGQKDPAFELIQKSRLAKMLPQWTAADIGSSIVNPQWNYDSFTKYEILDKNGVSTGTSQVLYYCTFTANNNKHGYVVIEYDSANGGGLGNRGAVATTNLYDLRANGEALSPLLAGTDLDLSTTVATRISQVEDNNGTLVEGIQFVDKSGRNYIYYFADASMQKVN